MSFDERTGLLSSDEIDNNKNNRKKNNNNNTSSLRDLFEPVSSTAEIRPYESVGDIPFKEQEEKQQVNRFWTISYITTTLIGSITFLIYHVVFCLAFAATVAPSQFTGQIAQLAALGIVTAGLLFIYTVKYIPAVYPTADLFLAPFLSQVARKIINTMSDENEINEKFLCTFTIVVSFGLFMSGILCVIAAHIKLASLGSFLPYTVLCGFFTTIGILMWMLGFKVDTGSTVGDVLSQQFRPHADNDKPNWLYILYHHIPSIIVGICMHILGKKNPLWVPILLITTMLGTYGILWITGTSFQQAQDAKWFFTMDELAHPSANEGFTGTNMYGPPYPFGGLASLWTGRVDWEAAKATMPTVLALVFLYLIRSSLHSAALQRNARNVTRRNDDGTIASPFDKIGMPLGQILEQGYGYSQLLASIIGGISVAPSLAASFTMFQLKAEGRAPQVVSCILILIFYLTDFTFVQYIPKPAFSCLMVLAGLDMIRNWLLDSFQKSRAKVEWLVAPMLIVFAFTFSLLNAIFIGVAMSTFIFAANFYRAGIVKFVGTGLTLRSPVERGLAESQWLDQNADWIQILVLQNYVFFGNAQSVLRYITTMFDEMNGEETLTPPIPKYLVVDFAMVSGVDTSAVDLFHEILVLCNQHQSKLFLSGMNLEIKAMFAHAGIKPSTQNRSKLTFTPDLESALAKAEDSLLATAFQWQEKDEMETSMRARQRSESNVEDGFIYALKKIDEQHHLSCVEHLRDLEALTTPITLEPGDILFQEGSVHDGLYFVETCLLRIQHKSHYTTMGISSAVRDSSGKEVPSGMVIPRNESIGHLNARTGTIGRKQIIFKSERGRGDVVNEQSFRLARFGAGWIIGSLETSAGMRKPGELVAVSQCRLHHLPPSRIKELENNSPTLAMNLYKVLSNLSTKRQEMTIRQLAQMLRVLNNPTPRLRGGKEALAQLQGFQFI